MAKITLSERFPNTDPPHRRDISLQQLLICIFLVAAPFVITRIYNRVEEHGNILAKSHFDRNITFWETLPPNPFDPKTYGLPLPKWHPRLHAEGKVTRNKITTITADGNHTTISSSSDAIPHLHVHLSKHSNLQQTNSSRFTRGLIELLRNTSTAPPAPPSSRKLKRR